MAENLKRLLDLADKARALKNPLKLGKELCAIGKKPHGNKLDDKPAEGYSLRDRDNGDVKKYGETTRGEDKFGSGGQKRYPQKYLEEQNIDYVKEVSGTKKDMHKWQHEKILEYKMGHEGKRPGLNKSDY